MMQGGPVRRVSAEVTQGERVSRETFCILYRDGERRTKIRCVSYIREKSKVSDAPQYIFNKAIRRIHNESSGVIAPICARYTYIHAYTYIYCVFFNDRERQHKRIVRAIHPLPLPASKDADVRPAEGKKLGKLTREA